MKLISKGYFDISYNFLLIILILGLPWIPYYVFSEAYSQTYLQIDKFIIAIILSLVVLYALYRAIEEFKAINVYETHIRFKRLFGLLNYTIPIDKIEVYSISKKKEIDYIIFKVGNKIIYANEKLIENDLELFEHLKSCRVKRRDGIQFKNYTKIMNKAFALFIMTMSIVCAIIFFNTYFKKETPIEYNSLIKISGTLSSKPDIKKPTAKSSSKYIHLKLMGYPEIKFEINSTGYSITDLKKIRTYEKATPAELLISKREFEIKILKTKEPTFSEKHFSWDKIYSYGLTLNSSQIFSFEDYKKKSEEIDKENKDWGWISLPISIALLIWGIKQYRKYFSIDSKV